ncbi:hypothetical protein L1987_02389 [Smallanthus sonchifolius]|uniref:Uncharacterized protein n=1 Tax=Smallanthus sonchifolius TaxID=185202 RepID=A0ACB9K7V8_9ASTR|nr:hypothetical protein L1987_02389 [Smallanthus sonchifolius]
MSTPHFFLCKLLGCSSHPFCLLCFVDTCNTKRVCGSDDSALPLEACSKHQKSLWFGWFSRAPRSGFESVGDLFFVPFLPT